MTKPRHLLRLKRLDEISLVDVGANQRANIAIWKRAAPAIKALSFAEARAKMDAERETWQYTDVLHQVMRSIMEDDEMDGAAKRELMDRSIDEFAAEMKGAMPAIVKHESGDNQMATKPFDPKSLSPEGQAAFAEVTKRAETAEAKVAELTPPPAPVLPAEVQKRLDETEKRAKEAEERIAKMELTNRTAEFVQKAKGYTHLPIKAETFGPILRKAQDGEKLTEDEAKELDRVLSAANEAQRTGALFQEVGVGGEAEGSATAKVAKLAAKAREANPKMSETQARAEVYKTNPGLMTEVEDEDKQRAARR